MILYWPQLTVIILMSMGVSLNLILHGQPKKDNYSIWWCLFGDGLHLWLLTQGGFFDGH